MTDEIKEAIKSAIETHEKINRRYGMLMMLTHTVILGFVILMVVLYD